MNCLCCGKKLNVDDGSSGWHKKCIRDFFGTSELPDIDINNKNLELLALKSTDKGFTVPGVQKKLSMHLFSGKERARLTFVDYPTGYILKPQVEEFHSLPEAEHLVMCMADAAGILTVRHAMIRYGNSLAYITKRADREFKGDKFRMIAMEDFCQLDQRLTADKYRGSYERCAKVIERYSSRSGLDMTEMYMRIVFSFIVGNSDMHLKNFSLIETSAGSGRYVLSPAYDLLPVNIIMPEDREELALTLNGKKRNIRKKDFIIFSEKCEINKAAAEKMIRRLIEMHDVFIEMCRASFLPDEMKTALCELIDLRCNILDASVN